MTTGDVSGGQPAGPAKNVDGVIFDLRLYTAGQSPKSILAIENLRRVCDEYLAGRFRIEVIDLLETPELARAAEIIAVPTLVRRGRPSGGPPSLPGRRHDPHQRQRPGR